GGRRADPPAPLAPRLGPVRAGARVAGDLIAEREQPGDTRRDATRHHLLDGGAAEAAQRACIGERHDPLADGVHAADPGAEHRARVPADLVVTARGTGET